MVFYHFVGMIGESEERHEPTHVENPVLSDDQVFLSNIAKHVDDKDLKRTHAPQERSDNLGRISGFAVGVGSLYLQEALGYPLVVLRHQCQVNHSAIKYHIQPFSLFRVIGRINHRQGVSAFWKGWGSSCIVKGVTILTEVAICEILHLSRTNDHGKVKSNKTSKMTIISHEILKGISLLLTLPLYSAALSDTIQTLAMDTQRSIFGFIKDAALRVTGNYMTRGYGRLLPFYSLIVPSILYGVLRFSIKSFLSFFLVKLYNNKYKIDKETNNKRIQKVYYTELMSNLLSSLFTEILIFPFETVIIRLHVQGTRTIIDDTDKGIGVVPLCTNYTGMVDCFGTIKREEGFAGLYKGFGALILQYCIQAVIVKAAKPLYSVET